MPTLDDVFAALGNPVRRRILELIRTGSKSAGEIAAAFELSRPAVSEHLQVLRNAGLLSEEAHGRHRLYRVDGGGLAAARQWLRPFELYWRRRMNALSEPAGDEEEGDE